jgi:cell division GTPase FtsZ
MSIEGAKGVLLNITGGRNLGLHEISEAASIIYEQAEEDAHIILGSVIDESMGDEVTVTIIATGFEKTKKEENCEDIRLKGTIVDKSEEQEDQMSPLTEDFNNKQIEKEQEKTQQNMNLSEEKQNISDKLNQEKTKKSGAMINLDELDIPTFMRNSVEEIVKGE